MAVSSGSSSVHRGPAALADARAQRAIALLARLAPDARGAIAGGTHEHDVGHADGRFLVHDAALHVLLRIAPGVLLDDLGVLHGDGAFGAVHGQDARRTGGEAQAIAPGDDAHHVALADENRNARGAAIRSFLYAHDFALSRTLTSSLFLVRSFLRSSLHAHGYQTSGASETILVNLRSRSSRATGPKTRVPTGSFASLMSTAALSSKRMYVPSFRRCSFLVRTTTARTTLPFFTWPSGVASFTAAVMTSPSPAVSPASPPSGRMQVIWRAPELSATVSHVRI